MMRRHAELLGAIMGETRGCVELRKHVSWYLKGFPAGATSVARWRPWRTSRASTRCSPASTGARRTRSPSSARRGGRQGSPRRRVALPEGWLEDADGSGTGVSEGRRRGLRGLRSRAVRLCTADFTCPPPCA